MEPKHKDLIETSEAQNKANSIPADTSVPLEDSELEQVVGALSRPDHKDNEVKHRPM